MVQWVTVPYSVCQYSGVQWGTVLVNTPYIGVQWGTVLASELYKAQWLCTVGFSGIPKGTVALYRGCTVDLP